MSLGFYIIGILLLAAVAVPVFKWVKNHLAKTNEMKNRTAKYAINNFDKLVSPKFGVITEYRIRVAMLKASPSEREVLDFLLKDMPNVGHPIDSYVDIVPGSSHMGHPVSPSTVTTFIYGISRNDLFKMRDKSEPKK